MAGLTVPSINHIGRGQEIKERGSTQTCFHV